jgi:hypothetical protein
MVKSTRNELLREKMRVAAKKSEQKALGIFPIESKEESNK